MSYRCTVLLKMPDDDGQNIRPEEVVEWLQSRGIELVDWLDEDVVPADKRTTDDQPASLPGWCPMCNRDIRKEADHAIGCEWKSYGPDHPEIRPC